jgi:hypothetical protein
MESGWIDLPADLLRLIIFTSETVQTLGRLSCTCATFKRYLYESIDLWKLFAAYAIRPNTILSELTVSHFQAELNKLAAVKRRIYSGEANVNVLHQSGSPYVRSAGRKSSRDEDDSYGSDSYQMYDVFECSGGDGIAIFNRTEESGSSWSSRYLISADIVSAGNPAVVLQALERSGDDFEDVQGLIGSKFLYRGGNMESDVQIYDVSTSESFEIDWSDVVKESALETFYAPNKGNRPWFAAVSSEEFSDAGEAQLAISVYDLETRQFCIKRHTLVCNSYVSAATFIHDTIFLQIGSTTLCLNISVDDGLEYTVEQLYLPRSGEIIEFGFSYVTLSEQVGKAPTDAGLFYRPAIKATTKVSMLSYPSGRLIAEKKIETERYQQLSAAGPFLVNRLRRSTIEILDIRSDSEFPIISLDNVSNFHLLAPGRWMFSQKHQLFYADFESDWTPTNAFITCFASSKPIVPQLGRDDVRSRVEASGNCAFIDLSVNGILEQITSILSCSVDFLSVKMIEGYDGYVIARSRLSLPSTSSKFVCP